MKHEGFTPGPWTAGTSPGRALIRATSGAFHPKDALLIAEVFTVSQLESERRANQALIAEAPILLAENERLRAALADLIDWTENVPTNLEDDTRIGRARLALAEKP